MAGQDRSADQRPVTYRLEDPYNKCQGSRVLTPQEAAELLQNQRAVTNGVACKPGETVLVPTGR